MSLGRSVSKRTTPLAFSDTVSASREFLTFLYPRWFVSESRSRYRSSLSRTHLADGTRKNEISPKLSVQSLDDPLGVSLHDSSDSGQTSLKHHLRSESDAKSPPIRQLKILRNREVQAADDLRDIFAVDHGQEGQIRASWARSKKSLEFQRASNSLFKLKGTWSYDWRVPLLILKQAYQTNTEQCSPISVIRRAGRGPQYRGLYLHEIHEPSQWSSASFAAYIDQLTRSRKSPLISYQSAHVNTVKDMLMSLFLNETYRPYLTSLAFNSAFTFFYQHSMIDCVRKLFTFMADSELRIPLETFNIMLKGAASAKDLYHYTLLLRLMVQSDVRPNAESWLQFLAAVESKAVKQELFTYMQDYGFLKDLRVLKAAAHQLIAVELEQTVKHGMPLETFIEHQDSKYGKNWMSSPSANLICAELSNKGVVSEVAILMDIMAQRNCRPDRVTLKILLRQCKILGSSRRALQTLRLFAQQYGVEAGPEEYHTLLLSSWKSREFNCCRVVWRAWCLTGSVDYRIQQLVLNSLLQSGPVAPDDSLQTWLREAGKFMVGIESSEHQSPAEQSRDQTSVGQSIKYSESGQTNEERRINARSILSKDLAASKQYMLGKEFVDLFQRAVDIDEQWQKDSTWGNSLEWKLEHAAHVDIKPRLTGGSKLGGSKPSRQ